MQLYKTGWLLVGCLFAVPAAAETENFVFSQGDKKFFALPDRLETPATPPPASALGASPQSNSKFLLLDRARTAPPVQAQRLTPAPLPTVTRGDPAVKTVRGGAGDQAVLGLFPATPMVPLAPRAAASSARVSHGWPLPAWVKQRISSGYGMRRDPFHGQARFHGGLDIAAPSGTPVLATADGRVIDAGRRGGLGNYIRLSHGDGSISEYNHLQSVPSIAAGTAVSKGQEIARLGSTGRSTGPHLDYRLKIAGQRVDPMTQLASVAPVAAPRGTSVAERQPFLRRIGGQAADTSGLVRRQRGVIIITPQQRVAMRGGIIKVR